MTSLAARAGFVALWLAALLPQPAPGQDTTVTPRETVRLADLERLALEHNPTLAQAGARAAAAEGRRRQALVGPAPTIGYAAEDIHLREPGEAEHFLFVEQQFLFGNPLGARARVYEAERAVAEAQLAAQTQRAVNGVRLLWWEALAAQQAIELQRELRDIHSEAVTTTEQLYNVGQADQPDVLEILIENEQAMTDLERSESRLRAAWGQLAALTGLPGQPVPRLEGDLAAELPTPDLAALRRRVTRDHPLAAAARAEVVRAEAEVAAARASGAGDLTVRGAVGYDFDRDELNRQGGVTLGIELAFGLPESTAGAVAAAQAELLAAQLEAQRVELLLTSLFDAAAERYQATAQAAERYRTRILPLAEQSFHLYQNRFREMAAAYPQVLIARRRLAQLRLAYLDDLRTLRREAIGLEGLLLTDPLAGPGETAAGAGGEEAAGSAMLGAAGGEDEE